MFSLSFRSILHALSLTLCLASVGILVGCSESSTDSEASAEITQLAASGVTGTLTFTGGEGSVTITGTVSGLPPNTEHGFHIHEKGDCGDATATDGTVTIGGAAGGHWNPAAHMHGSPDGESHLGDLGNLVADATGKATFSVTKAGMTIGDGSATDVLGKGVIVHANPDDLTSQPVGNAGGRIGCGVVTPAP